MPWSIFRINILIMIISEKNFCFRSGYKVFPPYRLICFMRCIVISNNVYDIIVYTLLKMPRLKRTFYFVRVISPSLFFLSALLLRNRNSLRQYYSPNFSFYPQVVQNNFDLRDLKISYESYFSWCIRHKWNIIVTPFFAPAQTNTLSYRIVLLSLFLCNRKRYRIFI